MKATLPLILLVLALASATAEAELQLCIYRRVDGGLVQVRSRAEVPSEYRAGARCLDAGRAASAGLAKPEDIELKGTVRSEHMTSAIGPIKLRWPRKVETLFGRTPSRAMAEAALTVSRALRKPGFPSALQGLSSVDWNIVFMDEASPEQSIPAYLISNCHPGWMTPPADIYIVGQRVAGGCTGLRRASAVADAELAEVLIHEIGHAVEYRILGAAAHGDRMRAEGFATWFEAYAAEFSFLIPKGSVKQRIFAVARAAPNAQTSAAEFDGSAVDYARASLYFHAIAARRGVPGLMAVYDALKGGAGDLFAAVEQQLHWDRKRLAAEAERVLAGG